MTNVDRLLRNSLVTIGAILTMLGIFLPWECYRGILNFCLSGLSVNWGALAYSSPIVLVVMAFAPAALYHMLTTHWQFREFWRIIVVTVIGAGFLFLAVEAKLFVDGGGLKFLVGSVITIWATFHIGRYSKAIVVGIPLLLVMFASYNLVKYFIPEYFDSGPGVVQWQGRVLLFLGSLVMLSGGLLWHRQTDESAA